MDRHRAISHTAPAGGHRDYSDNVSVVMVVMVGMVVMVEGMVPMAIGPGIHHNGAVTPIPVIQCVYRPVAVRGPCSADGTAL